MKRETRSRPPTTGQYVGIGKARSHAQALRHLDKQQREEQRERDLAETLEVTRRKRVSCPIPSRGSSDLPRADGAAAMLQRTETEISTVLAIAKKSGNLKGTYQKELRIATESLRDAIEYMSQRSSTDETQRLEREVSRLREENGSLRRELDELKTQVVALQSNKRERRARKEQQRNNRHQARSSSSSSRSRSTRRTARNIGDSSPPSPPPALQPTVSHVPSATEGPKQSTSTSSASSSSTLMDDFARRMMEQVGLMLNARLEALEDRLLPAQQLRPPLGCKAHPSTATPKSTQQRGSGAAGSPKPPVGTSTRGASDAKQARTAPSNLRAPVNRVVAGEPATSLLPPANPWIDVVRRGRKPKRAKEATSAPKSTNPTQEKKGRPPRVLPSADSKGSTAQLRSTKRGGRKRGNKSTATTVTPPTSSAPAQSSVKASKPPKSSAVVLTLSSEAEAAGHTYAELLATAKIKIKLADIGIASLRCRYTITGARMLEITGEGREAKVDALAAQLTTALAGVDIRIARPVKCADLRLSGLDDSVTPSEVADAQTQGGCRADEIRVGDIRLTLSGFGSVWARCPVQTANKLATMGRVTVGWSIVRVLLLQARPLQCYRCLELGHTKQRCTAVLDRSDCLSVRTARPPCGPLYPRRALSGMCSCGSPRGTPMRRV